MERLEKKLLSAVAKASSDFKLLEPGDRVMVAISGGKDSHVMLYLLRELQKKAPFHFSIFALNVDQGHPGFPSEVLPDFLTREGYEHVIITEDTYSVVTEKIPEGKTYCSLCSRLRRGILYTQAQKLGATKIALGHHRDDAIETLMLNLMYTGSMRAMPPKLISDDGRNTVIRPLSYVAEKTIARYAELMQFPILPCNLCGSQEQLKRKLVKKLLNELETSAPRVRESMLAAMTNVRPSQLLDHGLWRALDLPVSREGHTSDATVTDEELAATRARLPLIT
jgi:tRNA 2-thiocytidine biosynthesis protein TtcA